MKMKAALPFVCFAASLVLAIDLRMPGINTLKLRQAALGLRRGGVGYYPHSDFIHVDTGRVRQWCFDCSASVITGD